MSHTELIHTALYAGGFLVLFAIGEFLYHVLKVPVEITRKFVHLGTGIICLTFPFVLETHWSVLILTTSFVAILVTSMKFNLLKSINAVDRVTRGSFLFPIIIYLTFRIYLIYGQTDKPEIEGLSAYQTMNFGGTIYFVLPILILSVCDPLAALLGKKWPFGKYCIFKDNKTLMGSGVFLASAFVLSLIFLYPICPKIGSMLLIGSSIAMTSTLAEAVSQKGFDNLMIPLTVAAVLILFRDNLIL